MAAERIDGIKYHFDRLTDHELENIRGHLIESHNRIGHDIELVDAELFRRNTDGQEQLQFDGEFESTLGHLMITGKMDAAQALEAYEDR